MISRELIRLIYGVLLFLAFVIWLFAISGVAKAQGVTRVTAGGLIINMQDPQKIEFHCREGELTGPVKTPTAWVLSCKKKSNGGTPPPVDPPPSNCPPPTFTVPAQVPALFTGQREYAIRGNTVTVYQFNSDRYKSGEGVSDIGPHFGGTGSQSQMTTQTVTTCPGVLDFQKVDAACRGAGNISTITMRRGGSDAGKCNLTPNTVYYLNVSPYQPVTKKASCSICGIVHFIK